MSTPAKLRVGWHREHFLSPLLQLVDSAEGSNIELVEQPGGSGEMMVSLKENKIDVCIGLTEAFIAGIANGNQSFKLVGRYIKTPLRWAVITGAKSKYNSIDDLKGTKLGISRLGSGSQVMASVMSLQQKWAPEEQPSFEVKGSFKPLRDSVNSGETSVFLWEWFTTKPYADSGEVRFIGSVYTPWPCWVIAASTQADPSAVSTFLASLGKFAADFDSPAKREQEDVAYVSKTFGQQEEDVKEWLKTVAWHGEQAVVEEKVVLETLDVLEKAGVVKKPQQGWKAEDFVDTRVASIQ